MSEAMLIKKQLDPKTMERLENSLMVQILKLFAVIAKADPTVSIEERLFVLSYCEQLYPRKIAMYLFSRFGEFLQTDINVDEVIKTIKAQLSYQERIFCLLKLYELIVSDVATEKELQLSRRFSEQLQIVPADLAYVEGIFGVGQPPSDIPEDTSIIRLRVLDQPFEADLYVPVEGCHLEIYKISNLYCVRRIDHVTNTLVENNLVYTGVFTRIPRNADILIDDYTIKYHNLRYFFENKIHRFQAEIFLTMHEERFFWTYAQTEDSVLKIRLDGSLVQLTPVGDRKVSCRVNDVEVDASAQTHVNMDDDIVIGEHRLNLREIFFQLNRKKEISLNIDHDKLNITNDPRGDVFISDDLPDIWSVGLSRQNGGYNISKGDCPYQIRIDGEVLKGDRIVSRGQTIFINNRYLTFESTESKVEQKLFSFDKVEAYGVDYAFPDGTTGLDNISFKINYGDLVCIMGPSGCGKSTLLSLISGFYRPKQGIILMGDHNLYNEYGTIKDYLGFVPQDDLLHSNLTVYENLYYYAKLRFPDRSKKELDPQIDLVLKDLGLFEKKHSLVGSPIDKRLSGGQRKRLNIGLELLSNAEVFLLDEPTSGLSSKDSENIVGLLANIAASGKIVMTVIHQPSSKIYQMFDKVILLDRGGEMAYFGTTEDALSYFKEHRDRPADRAYGEVECPNCKSVQPDLLLDTLEESLDDVDGRSLSERKYSPQYWREQYDEYLKKKGLAETVLPEPSDLPPAQALTFTNRFSQLKTLIIRNFLSKMRDPSNLMITFLGAPFLGWGVGWVTKFAPHETYSLYANDLYETFLFTAVIAAIFFGMTNSIDEIITDRIIFLRERMLSLRKRSYLTAKVLVLIVFALIQNILYLKTGFWVLEVKELFWTHVTFLTFVSLAGIALGLFISAIPNISSKAAQNLVPIILIPQIILGGALIEFEQMNDKIKINKNNPIPEICQIMPSRWSYEGLMVIQAKFNRFDGEYDRLSKEMNELKRERPKLNKMKSSIIKEHGKEYYNKKKKELQARINQIEKSRDELMNSVGSKYGNAKIYGKVAMADASYKKAGGGQYNMMVSEKALPLIGRQVSTVIYNALIMGFFAALFLLSTLVMLRYKDEIGRGLLALRNFWRKGVQLRLAGAKG